MSLMDKYSAIYGIDIKEVKQWVNDYSKGNVPEGMYIEDSKEERIESIKRYIQSQVDDSVTGRIQADILNLRIANSNAKEVAVCPF